MTTTTITDGSTETTIHRLSDWRKGEASGVFFRCCHVPGEQEAPAGGWTFYAGQIGAEPADQKILIVGTAGDTPDEGDEEAMNEAVRLLGLAGEEA